MNLKKIREQKNISQKELAKLAGMHYRTVQEIELRDNTRIQTAIKLADALGVSLDELCRTTED